MHYAYLETSPRKRTWTKTGIEFSNRGTKKSLALVRRWGEGYFRINLKLRNSAIQESIPPIIRADQFDG